MFRNRRRQEQNLPAAVVEARSVEAARHSSRWDSAAIGQSSPVLRFLAVWSGPIVIAIVAVVMAAWTWNTWPDVLIDFGRELYNPWRLTQGEVLYRDIGFFFGPLSQYFNALCFSVFGASLRTLVFCNLTLLAMFIGLLYYALRQVGGRPAATVACVIFVLLFAFSQYVFFGNYNYVCPYCQEVTHGLMLSLAAIVAAWASGGRMLLRSALSGLALGLAFLTKAEVFLPGAVATGVALALGLWFERPGWRLGAGRLGCFLVAFLIPPVIAFLCLASAMPVQQALLGIVGSWGVMANREFVDLPFYRGVLGIDRPMENVQAMLSMTGLYALVLVPAGLLGLALRRTGRYHLMAVTAMVFFGAAGLLWCWREKWMGDIARPFPLLVAITILAVVIGFLQRRRDEAAQRRFVRQASLLVFAAILLLKMILNARIIHYGFVLAMPATLLLAVAALNWIPAFIDRRGGYGGVFTAATAAMLSVTVLAYLGLQTKFISAKIWHVGTGADAFWADRRGAYVNLALEEIAKRSRPDTTLAVLPEGIMINFLSKLRNPTPYPQLIPGVELITFPEDRVLDSFQSHPPDLIALVHKDTSEFGFHFFGHDYYQQLWAWLDANYQPCVLIGPPPLLDDNFGILLLERIERRDKNGPF
jgi:hypothetical protein